MAGTSRGLISDLNDVFNDWENEPNNLQTSQLFKSISAYHLKHSTLMSIQQSTNIHNELHRFYNNHIFPKSNLPREMLFIQILTELSPVLSQDEVELWLKTYLQPAVDSGNYDIQFVQACRDFINKVGINYETSSDSELTKRRHDISTMVMNYILDIYIEPAEKSSALFDLGASDDERKSQEFYERLRFIRSNCLTMLYDFALIHPKSFAVAVDHHFVDSKKRLRVLTLITNVLNSRSSKLHAIVETDLFVNVFRCLSFDFNERVLYACLAALVMLVPLVSDRISQYVSDLLVIYSRICVWNNYAFTIPYRIGMLRERFAKDHQEKWDIAVPDDLSYDRNVPFDSKITLDAGHLVSIIYGLFPYSLTLYSQDPLSYLEKYPSRLLPRRHLILINNAIGQDVSPKDKGVMDFVPEVTRMYLQSFILHPNFLYPERLSVEYEKKDPTKWLTDGKQDDSLGVEEIVIGCLSLNPSLGFFIPEGLDASTLGTKTSSEDGEANDIRHYHPSVTSTGKSSNGGSRTVSRTSSLAGPIFFNFGASGPQNSMTALSRKLSVVPTNLVIDSRKTSEISFKEVNYGVPESEYDDSIDSIVKNKNGDRQGSDPSKELFANHESLYNTKPRNDSAFSDQTHLNEIKTDVHSLLGDKVGSLRTQPSMASVDSSKETIFSTGSSGPTIQEQKKGFSGGALDFYQRELLLMKNEKEFASYMKHLIKFQYIKLKIQVNRQKKDGSLWEKSGEFLKDKVKYEKLTEEYSNLKQAFMELQNDMDEKLNKIKSEREDYYTKLLKIQQSQTESNESYTTIQAANTELKSQIDTLTKEVIPDKNKLINDLNFQLKDIKNDFELLEKEMAELKVSKISHEPSTSQVPEVVDSEKQIFNLKQEVNNLTDKNTKLEQELQFLKTSLESTNKGYESKMAANKNEIAYQLSSINNQHDKKIQELSSTLLKYESLLEDKNLRIAQLSSSRPISIPGSISNGSDPGRTSQSHLNGYNANRSSSSNNPHSQMMQTNGSSSTQFQQSQMYDSNPMDMYEANRQSSNSSNESMNGNVQLPFNTPPLHTPVSIPKNTPFGPPQPQPVPIVKGRGGYQKRSKKHM